MKLLILLLFLSGCATQKVNVDLDSCEDRGTIDGIRVIRCSEVKKVNN